MKPTRRIQTDDSEEALRLKSVKAGIELIIGISETMSANDQKSASDRACKGSLQRGHGEADAEDGLSRKRHGPARGCVI